MLFVFGAFLLFTAVQAAASRRRTRSIRTQNRFLKLVQQGRAVDRRATTARSCSRNRTAERLATPLFAVLVLIETTDVMFAVDSRAGRAGGEPRAVHRVHVERLRHPGPAGAVLPARRHARPLQLPAAGPGGDPRLRRREDDHRRTGTTSPRRLSLAGDRRIVLAVVDRRSRCEADAPARTGTAPTTTRAGRAGGTPPVASRRWRSSTRTSSGSVPPVSIVDVVSSTWPCAGSAATGSGCARSTPRAARRSTSARDRPLQVLRVRPGGDVFTFVQEIEHVDFVGAVEQLAGQGRHPAHATPTGGEGGTAAAQAARSRRWPRRSSGTTSGCSTAPDARPARDYLRSRGLAGDVARPFKLGWAPDDWDALEPRCSASAGELLRDDRPGVHQQGATACRTRSGRG